MIPNPEVWNKNKGRHIKGKLENHEKTVQEILFIFHQQNHVTTNSISVEKIELTMRLPCQLDNQMRSQYECDHQAYLVTPVQSPNQTMK